MICLTETTPCSPEELHLEAGKLKGNCYSGRETVSLIRG